MEIKKKVLGKMSVACLSLGMTFLLPSNDSQATGSSGSGCPSGTTASPGYTFVRFGVRVTHCPPDAGVVSNATCCRS